MSGITHYEFADAVVTRVDDDEHRGRIRVICAPIAGPNDEVQEWIEPFFPAAGQGHGFFFLPAPGDVVEIMYVAGSTDDIVHGQAFVFHPRFRWFAATYVHEDQLPPEFSASYGSRHGIKAQGGAVLMMGAEENEAALRADKVRLGSLDAGEPAVCGDSSESWHASMLSSVKTLAEQVALLTGYVMPADPAGATGKTAVGLAASLVATELTARINDFRTTLSTVVTVVKDPES